MNRENIYEALFAKVSAVDGIKTANRRLEHWSKVPAAKQPALFQAQKGESVQKKQGYPPVYLLRVDLWLYVHSGNDAKATPATALNGLLDALEAALAPETGEEEQTLRGLVQHCFINGQIETDEGTLGPQAVAIIPVEILAT